MFSSPNEPDHAPLRKLAIARENQINWAAMPYADERVTLLTDEQVSRYAILFNAIIRQALDKGCAAQDIACEVLSTLPYPIRHVLDRYGLGRFRVAQKINLDNPSDVYRIEHAHPQDWVMLGTHDTASIWQLAENWCEGRTAADWARYLASLNAPEAERARFVSDCSSRPGELIHSLFAALLASRARHVLIFFPDLFGMTERYNRPGIVQEDNWTLRIPPDFEHRYIERRRCGKALDIRRCLSMAIRARAACPQ
jgi:4-alpha-glucanotransferase